MPSSVYDLIIYLVSLLSTLLQKVKNILVGDLEWRDVKDIASLRIPLSFEQFRWANEIEGVKEVEEINIKQYGLIGSLLSMNIALVRPKKESTTLVRDLLKRLDSIPDTRLGFQPLNELNGHPQFIATSGREGMDGRKKFVTHLLPPRDIINVAIQLTKATLMKENDMLMVNSISRMETLVQRILLSIMLGCELTPQATQALASMSSVLLKRASITPEIKQQFRDWIADLVRHGVDEEDLAPSALSRIIKDKIKQDVAMLTVQERRSLQDLLEKDPEIDACATVLLTANNIAITITQAFEHAAHEAYLAGITTGSGAFIYPEQLVKMPIIQTLLEEMKENDILFYQEDDDTDYVSKIQNMKFLDCLYKESLCHSRFSDDDLIVRKTPISLSVDEARTIPAGTTIFIWHRYLETSPTSFDPDRFKESTAPRLGSHQFSPFSVGARRCPGERIAAVIFKIVVAVVAERSVMINEEKLTHEMDGVVLSSRNCNYGAAS